MDDVSPTGSNARKRRTGARPATPTETTVLGEGDGATELSRWDGMAK